MYKLFLNNNFTNSYYIPLLQLDIATLTGRLKQKLKNVQTILQ